MALPCLLTATAVQLDAADRAATHDALVRAMTLRLTFPSTLHSRKPVFVGHCRKAAQGCTARLDAFATFFIDAGETRGLDPWLLAALAFRESGLNPYAVGSAGERGLLQIHPHNRHAKALKWHRSEKHRKRCRKEPGACQQEIVNTAADMLTNAIADCGSVDEALAAYHSGVCRASSPYAARIERTRKRLLELGCPASSPLVEDATSMSIPPACDPHDDEKSLEVTLGSS